MAFKVFVREDDPVTLRGSLRLDRRTPGYWTDKLFL